jgi:hypothetical protein
MKTPSDVKAQNLKELNDSIAVSSSCLSARYYLERNQSILMMGEQLDFLSFSLLKVMNDEPSLLAAVSRANS